MKRGKPAFLGMSNTQIGVEVFGESDIRAIGFVSITTLRLRNQILSPLLECPDLNSDDRQDVIEIMRHIDGIMAVVQLAKDRYKHGERSNTAAAGQTESTVR